LLNTPEAPPRQTATFGGLVKVPLNQTVTLLVTNGLTFKAHCTPSPEDSTLNMASISVAVDEDGCQYCSMNLYGGSIETINIADGDVTVLSYDAGCDQPGGPFFLGGVPFSLAKPSGIAANGVMSCGVGVLGGDSVFSGLVIL
jgi:hypothetical protein